MYRLLKFKTKEDWVTRKESRDVVESKYLEVLRKESVELAKQGYYRSLILKEDDDDELLSEEVVAITLENGVCHTYLGEKANSLLRKFLLSIEPSLKSHNQVYKVENINGENYITKDKGMSLIKITLSDKQQEILNALLKSEAIYNRNSLEEIVFKHINSFKTCKGYLSVIEEKEGYNLVRISVNMLFDE